MNKEVWEQIWGKSEITLHDYLFDPYLGIDSGDLTPHVGQILEAAGGPVLEAGCGTGVWMEWLTYHGHQVIGLDYADRTLRCLHRQQPAFVLTTGDVRHLPCCGGAFAVVMSSGVLEHFSDHNDFAVLSRDLTACCTVEAGCALPFHISTGFDKSSGPIASSKTGCGLS